MTLEQVKWSIADSLARMSKRDGVNATVTGIYSVSKQADGSVAVTLDLSPPNIQWNGCEGLLVVFIDEDELNRTSGPDELLAILSGNETKH